MFVDLHNHILPGIDDGAVDMADAVAMVKQAADSGTSVMAATPHRSWAARKDCQRDWLLGQILALQNALDDAEVHVKVVEGAELTMTEDIIELLLSGTLPTLGGGPWILLEPPFDTFPRSAFPLIDRLNRNGFGVVLAHPERCAGIQSNISKFVQTFADYQIILQLTTGSLLGEFGISAQSTADTILRSVPPASLILGSDSHNCGPRPTHWLPPAISLASEVVGYDAAYAMASSIPASIVSNVIAL